MENVGAPGHSMGIGARLHDRRGHGRGGRRSRLLSDDANAAPTPDARSMTATGTVTERVQESLRTRLVALRRDLHQQPELAFNELRTARSLEAALRELGVDDIRRVGETGLVARVRGRDRAAPVVAVRGDIDALPIQEATGLSYASTIPN